MSDKNPKQYVDSFSYLIEVNRMEEIGRHYLNSDELCPLCTYVWNQLNDFERGFVLGAGIIMCDMSDEFQNKSITEIIFDK